MLVMQTTKPHSTSHFRITEGFLFIVFPFPSCAVSRVVVMMSKREMGNYETSFPLPQCKEPSPLWVRDRRFGSSPCPPFNEKAVGMSAARGRNRWVVGKQKDTRRHTAPFIEPERRKRTWRHPDVKTSSSNATCVNELKLFQGKTEGRE